MSPITQTSQFHALKRVLWFLEKRFESSDFPHLSYDILKKYIQDEEKKAEREYLKEKAISEQGRENLN